MQSQNFTMMCPAPVEDGFLSLVPVVGPLVGIALLLWLKRGPRDAQDVLGSALVAPASRFQRLLGFPVWLLLAGFALLWPAGVTAMINAAMLFQAEEFPQLVRHRVLEPTWGWTAAAMLVCSACFIHWLRTSSSSERDVLRVRAEA
ncbi:hypothetical protein BO221_36925 [Archangium sp. Cb G35]|uniref:hypothetical protein n=1 Tax=Archangium sp. Cb G35 TaxID=1920190 RepID=UPI000935B5FB|nr:hypothetical protein [Archangium sp. Cb G35]OJT19094.1 hypothetical protein BO221_36925 [Archangium sp. Cb G35]